ncbi:MAG: nitroreductase family protein [Chloroflexota bacterium]
MTAGPPTPREAVRPLLRVRQVREFRTDAPVTEAELAAIADAARWSGSSQNSQPWRFITMREAATLRAIWEAGLPQTRSLDTASAAIGIVMPVQEGKAVAFAFDEGRAAERILVAATLLGLGAGIAWIGSAARPAVAELLGVPEGWSLRTVVALGHPTAAAAARKAPAGVARLPRGETVRPERWRE